MGCGHGSYPEVGEGGLGWAPGAREETTIAKSEKFENPGNQNSANAESERSRLGRAAGGSCLSGAGVVERSAWLLACVARSCSVHTMLSALE